MAEEKKPVTKEKKPRKPRSKTVHCFAFWTDGKGFLKKGNEYSFNSSEAMTFEKKPEALKKAKAIQSLFATEITIVDLISVK